MAFEDAERLGAGGGREALALAAEAAGVLTDDPAVQLLHARLLWEVGDEPREALGATDRALAAGADALKVRLLRARCLADLIGAGEATASEVDGEADALTALGPGEGRSGAPPLGGCRGPGRRRGRAPARRGGGRGGPRRRRASPPAGAAPAGGAGVSSRRGARPTGSRRGEGLRRGPRDPGGGAPAAGPPGGGQAGSRGRAGARPPRTDRGRGRGGAWPHGLGPRAGRGSVNHDATHTALKAANAALARGDRTEAARQLEVARRETP